MLPFEAQATLYADEIGKMIHFLDDLDGTDAKRTLTFNITVLDQYGHTMKVRTGDEVPYLGDAQVTQLLNFMAARRAALPEDLNFAAGNTVGRCTWRFLDGDGSAGSRSIFGRVIELHPDGHVVKVHKYNALPYLIAPQISGALAFMTLQRNKAYDEIVQD